MQTDRELMQQILDAWDRPHGINWHDFAPYMHALRARLMEPEIEDLGEIVPADEEQLKRIAKLVEPEPVAWITTWNEKENAGVELHWAKLDKGASSKHTPLYTTPPQREWQGLTDEDLGVYTDKLEEFARAIEAKLKEKNT